MATNKKKSVIIAAVLALLCSIGLSAETGRLARLNYREMQDGQLVIELKGSQRFRYRVKEFDSPPHLLIQLYNTTLGLPYNDLKIGKAGVSNISVRELQVNGETATFVSVHSQQKLDYDFDLIDNGRTFQLTTRPAAVPATTQSTAQGQPQGADQAQTTTSFEIPPVIHVPGERQGTTQIPYTQTGLAPNSAEIPYRVKEYDTSPYIVGPVILQDADISQTVRLLSEAAGGANIVVESSLVSSGATMNASGAVGGGITVTLSHITLEDALDIIAASNNWTWRKYGDYYAIMSKDTALTGVKTVEAGTVYEDSGSQMKLVVIQPEYSYACNIIVQLSTVIPDLGCDNSKNLIFMRGIDRDLNRARELLATLDVPQQKVTKRATQVTRIVRLKYVELNSAFLDELRELVTNSYFGGLKITADTVVASGTQTASSINTLTIDYDSNSMVFVGDDYIYERFYNVVKELDIPSRVTVAKVIPLKYAMVSDLRKLEELKTDLLGTARGGAGKPKLAFNDTTNSITYIGTQDDYERVLKIVRSLDVKEREYITEVYNLKNISVSDMEKSKILDRISNLPGFGLKGDVDDDYGVTDINVDKQTNSIVISTQRQYMPKIKKLIEAMDRNIFDNLEFEVFKLTYYPPTRAVLLLTTLMRSQGSTKLDVGPEGDFFVSVKLSDVSEINGDKSDGYLQSDKWALFPSTVDSSVYAIARKPEMDMMREIVKSFDQPYDQVKLDVQLVELLRNDQSNYKLGYAYQDGRVSLGGLIEGDTIFNGTESYFDGMPHDVKADDVKASNGFFVYDTLAQRVAGFASSLDVLVEKINSRIIANPSVMVSESTAVTFDFSERQPYTVVAFDQIEIRYANDGLVLKATPHFRNEYILLDMDLKISEVTGTTSQGYPIENVRNIVSEIKMENEIPFIIGGMIKTQDSLTRVSFPIISDLPLVGSLFRKKRRTVKEYEVVIVITPTVIKVK